MEWLVLLHVVSAVVGLGPAYAFPLILKKEQSLVEVKRLTDLVNRLEILPKIFGMLTLITGVLLVWFGDYGTFLTLWIAGALILFLLAEVVIIGLLTPAAKKLSNMVAQLMDQGKTESDPITIGLLTKVRNFHITSCVMVLVIIALMVLKPV
ncbi:DUF2269 family protein [Neobacillus sp. LXY-1]|uniref:DUF2269 family protein n=1 Tax=Neobacillus sp. LXY-1 TaxID=3379133 RepID=UPI003EE2081F